MTPQSIILDGDTFLTFRASSWDERAFNMPVREILSLSFQDKNGAGALLESFDRHCRNEQVGLAFIRLQSQDKERIALIQNHGFRFVESTLLLRLKHLSHWQPLVKRPTRLTLHDAVADDMPAIRALAHDHIHHGRFHEDPYMDHCHSRLRFSRWMDDHFMGEQPLWVTRRGNKILAFLAISISYPHAKLLLGASLPDARPLATIFMWQSALGRLRDMELKTVQAMVSTANLLSLNLHLKLGFQCMESLVGLHRHYFQESLNIRSFSPSDQST